MAVNDVYELTLKGTQDSQEVTNVFQYDQIALVGSLSGTTAQALAQSFIEQTLPAIVSAIHASVVYSSIKTINLFDDTDFDDEVLTTLQGEGQRGGSSLPTFNAASLTFESLHRHIKPGHKRFPGVSQSDVSADYYVAGTEITQLNNLATQLAKNLTVGAIIPVDCFAPCIVKRVRTGAPHAYHYRMPHVISEKVVSYLGGVLVNLLVSSQYSRKVGVGR